MATPAASTWFRIAFLVASCASRAYAGAGAPVASPVPLFVPNAADGPGHSTLPPLTITSDSICPSGPAVAAALAALIPSTEWPRGTVRIQVAADACVVDLVSEASTVRQLSLPADCALRATTLALVIATWTGELASEATGAPVLTRRTRGGGSEAPARALEVAPAHPVTTVTERELAVGLLLSTLGGVAPGVRLDFIQTRAPCGLGWQVGLALPDQRERAVGGGTTSWTRAAVNVGVNGRTTLHRLAVSADAGLAGAYTFTSGHGYSAHQSWDALTGGLAAGARIALTGWRMRVWTDVRGYKWLFPQALSVESPEGEPLASASLPSFEFHWAAGLAYLFH